MYCIIIIYFIVMRFIHVPPAGVLGATLPYVLTQINWLNVLYIVLHYNKVCENSLSILKKGNVEHVIIHRYELSNR